MATLADLGGVRRVRPPTGPNSFIFAYIFTEKGLRRRFTSPNGSTPPFTGNSGFTTGLGLTARYLSKTFHVPKRIFVIFSDPRHKTALGLQYKTQHYVIIVASFTLRSFWHGKQPFSAAV